jgi:hypothetical protein
MEVRQGNVVLRGESSQVTELIGLLESSPLFEGVSFQSSVVQSGTSGRDRFHLAARVVDPSQP